ncbi:MAG: DUF1298 domain-containing protein [Actinobacteria bacterium]|nr:DUF1298 domain-containing protein [Actinomycetota bacterium]
MHPRTAPRQVSGGDAFHLIQETDRRPMHTLKIAVLDVGDDRGAPTTDEVRAWVAAVVERVPALRWRLHHAPLHLARPYWVETPDLDLDDHLRFRSLRDDETLDDLLGDLAGARLDRDLPLWILWVVTGPDPDRLTLVLQIHHAIADGAASVQLWHALADLDTDPPEAAEAAEAPAAPPDRRTIAADALRAQVDQVRRIPGQWRRFRRYLAHASATTGDDVVTKAFLGPATRFNRPLSATRTCTFVTVPLTDLQRVRQVRDCTFNEAYLALCGGAVRRYLEAHDEPTDVPFTACTPAAVDRNGVAWGNSVTTWYLSLATDVAEPSDRVDAVKRSARATRAATELDPELLPDWQRYALGNLAIVKIMGVAERVTGRPAYNSIVSNVRGPAPFELLGRPVVELRSIGPLSGTMGLNMTAWSYGDDFTIGLHACRDHVDDLTALAECFAPELDALLSAG